MGSEIKRTKVTWASLAAFLVFFLGAGISLARPVSLLVESLRQPAIFLAEAPRPWLFFVLTGLWLVLGYAVIHAHLAPRRLARPVAVAFLLLCSGIVLLRMRPSPPNTPRPAVRAEAALDRAEALLAEASSGKDHLPTRFPIEGVLRSDDGVLETGYLGRGRALPFRIVNREPGGGAALGAREGDPPGTIYYRVDAGAQDRYWLTVLVLGAHPVGPVRFLRDPDGRPLIREGTLQALQRP